MLVVQAVRHGWRAWLSDYPRVSGVVFVEVTGVDINSVGIGGIDSRDIDRRIC